MPGDNHETKPISLFYSYSHKDEELRLKLQDHLAALRWSGMIAEWHDRDIEAGKEWEKEIDHHLSSADIILLLVSASFIASPYCWSVEVKKALKRHERGEARVIPVILRPCRWQRTPFAKFQATPKDARPVTDWPDEHAAFDDVVSKIEAVVVELQRRVPTFAVFRDVDAPWCPEMVALPAGEFLMGSPESEEGRRDAEGPQHEVTIGTRFAIGRYPVTVEEYCRFVEATGHRHEGGMYVWTGSEWKEDASKSWRNPGFAQTDRHPVVGVSFRDAVAYCEWLSQETGKPYRLPSEAEWEYAVRAWTTTRYAFGDEITEKEANFGRNVGRSTDVGAYPANPWGLQDMHGNVWEWVKDIWHDSYQGASTDGAAWTEQEGKNSSRYRVYRGGSWGNVPGDLRSAYRDGGDPEDRDIYLGFRIARTLD